MKFEILKKTLALAMVLVSIGAFASCDKKDSGKEKADSDISVADDAEIEDKDEAEEDEDSDEEKHYIDLDALKSIEAEDSFDVKITKKEIKKGEFGQDFFGLNDAAVFTIQNDSDDNIVSVTIYTATYNKHEELMIIGNGLPSFGDDPFVQTFTTEDTEIKAGASEALPLKCDATEIDGMRAIVAEYTTADGKTHKNSSAAEWYRSAEIGANISLD